MAPKRKSSDACSSSKPKRTREVLTISEKVLILDLIQKEKKSYSEVARMYGKNESSIREMVKNGEKIRSSFALAPQTAKVTSTVRDKALLKMEKALNLWVEEMNRKHVPLDGKVLRQKALSLYEDFKKESTEGRESKPFAASKGWLHRFRNRHNLKNIRLTGEAASTNKETAAPLKPETVNACWDNLWTEVVNDFKDFPAIDGEANRIAHIARQVGGEGFVNKLNEGVGKHREDLTNAELEELIKSSAKEIKQEEIETEPAVWTWEKFGEVFQIAQTLKDKIVEYDPVMERSIKITHTITKALQPLQQMFDELKRMKRPPIMKLSRKVEKQAKFTINIGGNPPPSILSAPDNTQPSASSAISPAFRFKVSRTLKEDDPELSPD
ncbi:uncharacterized protein [Tiliqua scincoides]|uniref:uncharacterized protein n=1 Tax=Tiliqua scincoides TaxID=71010 RepID=UPI0034620BC4